MPIGQEGCAENWRAGLNALRLQDMSLEEFRKKRAAQKQDAIRRAAERLFLKRGFDGASIEMIAAEAEVSTATVYSHFGSKRGICSPPSLRRRPAI